MKKRTQLLLKMLRERFFTSNKETGTDHNLSNLRKMNKSTLFATAPEFENCNP